MPESSAQRDLRSICMFIKKTKQGKHLLPLCLRPILRPLLRSFLPGTCFEQKISEELCLPGSSLFLAGGCTVRGDFSLGCWSAIKMKNENSSQRSKWGRPQWHSVFQWSFYKFCAHSSQIRLFGCPVVNQYLLYAFCILGLHWYSPPVAFLVPVFPIA